MIDELNLILIEGGSEPCEHALNQLEESGSGRTFSLALLHGPDGQCVWCSKPLRGKQRRWCGERCADAAYRRCYPQSPSAKMYRLIYGQGFACAGCGTSYEEEIRRMIRVAFGRINHFKKPGDVPNLVTLHTLGAGTGEKWQTDHIKPVGIGGRGIDPNNLQVLCVECHRQKTARENTLYGLTVPGENDRIDDKGGNNVET